MDVASPALQAPQLGKRKQRASDGSASPRGGRSGALKKVSSRCDAEVFHNHVRSSLAHMDPKLSSRMLVSETEDVSSDAGALQSTCTTVELTF